jgi:hypothetical protein
MVREHEQLERDGQYRFVDVESRTRFRGAV